MRYRFVDSVIVPFYNDLICLSAVCSDTALLWSWHERRPQIRQCPNSRKQLGVCDFLHIGRLLSGNGRQETEHGDSLCPCKREIKETLDVQKWDKSHMRARIVSHALRRLSMSSFLTFYTVREEYISYHQYAFWPS